MADQRGNVYVEALVALAILAVAIVPAFGMLGMTPSVQRQAADTVTAMNIARSQLESFESVDRATWDNLPATGGNVTKNGRPMTQVPDQEQSNFKISITSAQPDPTLNLKNITVTIDWDDGHGNSYSFALATAVARRQ